MMNMTTVDPCSIWAQTKKACLDRNNTNMIDSFFLYIMNANSIIIYLKIYWLCSENKLSPFIQLNHHILCLLCTTIISDFRALYSLKSSLRSLYGPCCVAYSLIRVFLTISMAKLQKLNICFLHRIFKFYETEKITTKQFLLFINGFFE